MHILEGVSRLFHVNDEIKLRSRSGNGSGMKSLNAPALGPTLPAKSKFKVSEGSPLRSRSDGRGPLHPAVSTSGIKFEQKGSAALELCRTAAVKEGGKKEKEWSRRIILSSINFIRLPRRRGFSRIIGGKSQTLVSKSKQFHFLRTLLGYDETSRAWKMKISFYR